MQNEIGFARYTDDIDGRYVAILDLPWRVSDQAGLAPSDGPRPSLDVVAHSVDEEIYFSAELRNAEDTEPALRVGCTEDGLEINGERVANIESVERDPSNASKAYFAVRMPFVADVHWNSSVAVHLCGQKYELSNQGVVGFLRFLTLRLPLQLTGYPLHSLATAWPEHDGVTFRLSPTILQQTGDDGMLITARGSSRGTDGLRLWLRETRRSELIDRRNIAAFDALRDCGEIHWQSATGREEVGRVIQSHGDLVFTTIITPTSLLLQTEPRPVLVICDRRFEIPESPPGTTGFWEMARAMSGAEDQDSPADGSEPTSLFEH